MLDTGFVYGTFECWRNINGTGLFWTECVSNVANAWEAGFEYVDIYMFPHRYAEPTTQVIELLNNLTIYNVTYGAVMIDIEGDDWIDFTQEENRQFMLELRSVFDSENISMTIYTGATWDRNFGDNFTDFSDLPLIYAHYDNIPSFYDYNYSPYGGWEVASGKQFWDAVDDEIVCDISLDWDWSPISFWKH